MKRLVLMGALALAAGCGGDEPPGLLPRGGRRATTRSSA
jgi:hypothetical protein